MSTDRRIVKVGDVWRWRYSDKMFHHLLVLKEPSIPEDSWLCYNFDEGRTQYWMMSVNDYDEDCDWEQVSG